MRKNRVLNTTAHLLPFAVIQSATEGDVSAINQVLKHYESYILKLATREGYDEFGERHYWVDEEVKRRLEIRLIAMTLKFKTGKG